MKGSLTLLVFCACWCSLVMGCGRRRRCRRCPPHDTTKPTITCPPDRHEIADPFQINTKVWWNESSIVANDNRDGSIKGTRTGKAPGELFFEGITTIEYHAKDKSGNYASCSFKITVKVLRCNSWDDVPDGWKICNVSHDMRLGSICRFGCYGGHELVGANRTECLESEQWDTATQPYCQKLQCVDLFPTPDQYGIVSIECTDDNYYRSICSYNCVVGYSVLPGHSKIRVCNEFGIWRGSMPMCVDIEPPVYTDCPYVKVGYAERTKTSGRIWWYDPTATDNSGSVTSTQISGPESGSDLQVGEHTVQYMAYDTSNNTAICEFKVVVKQINCHTIYPLPYTSTVCPNGRSYGSTCQFMCAKGAVLNGPANVECDKTDSNVSYGVWTFRDRQPYCELQNTCQELRAPDNGALACDTWLNGRYCQMLCEDGYVVVDDPDTTLDEVRIHKTLVVCGNSGIWHISGDIPNCQEIDPLLERILRINIEYLYYDGPCDETREDIKNKFIKAFTEGTQQTCQPPDCQVSLVQVICGDRYDGTDRRRKAITTGISFEINVDLSRNQSSIETATTRSLIINSLLATRQSGNLDIQIDGTVNRPSSIQVSQPEGSCNDGSAYNKKTFQCVKCNNGYFHDTKSDVCSPCARGYYQDEPQQSSCKQCPIGKTTKSKGAHSVSQCEEACQAGFYSATGTPPCSACDLGWFSEDYGSTECTQCQGSQITLIAGATSGSQCKEFDITYNKLNESEELSVATLNLVVADMSQFTLTLFVKCKQCNSIFNITDTDQTILSIINTDELLVEYNGHQYKTGENLIDSMLWTQLTVVHTGAELFVYLNARKVLKEQSNRERRSTDTTLNVTIGGEGFIGSVSQMNIWSDVNAYTSVETDTCFGTDKGDLINWRQFSELDGSFVLTKSNCDVDNNCRSSPCENGGSCSDSVGSFSCACLRGYTGSLCEVNINDCLDNACDNNATCIDGEDVYTCVCSEGFTGQLCETQLVDGGWTEWKTSSECSVTCGQGWQQLSRVCENPNPINGGKECEGDDTKVIVCETNTTCINECVKEPSHLENGTMNCEWTDNETRVCKPACDKGFVFDSDMFVNTSGIICGPDTGYTWNINNTDNPQSQIPSCTPKIPALSNKLNYTAGYETLSLTTLNSGLISDIKAVVNGKVRRTGCVSNGSCVLQDIHVFSSSQLSERKRRETIYVMFTIELTCDITAGINQCYDLLAEIVGALNTYIENLEFTIQYGGSDYDVGVNSSPLDGVSVCEPGHVSVWQYCVSCGKGTYATNDCCERCPRGYYQDKEAQTSCKQCPEGWTTAGLMTRDKEYCNIATVTAVHDSESKMNWLMTGFVIAGSVVCVTVITVLWIFCKSLKNETSPDKNVTSQEETELASGPNKTTHEESNQSQPPRLDLAEVVFGSDECDK
ncbi:uncharacterized protein LOC128546131 isoform X1 [Mercenaria mercenaria]|uniref:uncharacterized protein LOC128546131 isoform X1 n=1 Tax=Mercenaria mercenaria TaxID=6596 RepID=UPI00234E4AFF|nr:uncharacterized protein LOC128546131 isoform X1 [Mercenaria mercenaria]